MKYEYGVEYPTNGKKPDLPGDVLVEQFWVGQWIGPLKFSTWSWGGVTAFRIVDERYKPNPEDNSCFERGELPPVGTICEQLQLDGWWRAVEITAHGRFTITVYSEKEKVEYLVYKHNSRFRPIRTEREKAIEAAFSCLKNSGFDSDSTNTDYFDALYDAGLLRLPEEK